MAAILAHRANISGPSPERENRLPQIEQALRRGWGLEVDIRRDQDGRFYLAHDLLPDAGAGLPADSFCAALRRAPAARVALNLKELGYERDLLRFLSDQNVLPQMVLFDMELIEPRAGDTARLLRALHPTVSIAARVSDRGEPLARALAIETAMVIWLDEFDGPWATAADVQRLRAAGREIFAVSPDLHGGSLRRAQARWADFIAWGVDAICTDYPAALALFLHTRTLGATA